RRHAGSWPSCEQKGRREMVEIAVGTYRIDPSHSEVGFTVRHAGIAKVRGKFESYEGVIIVGEDLRASSVEVSIDSGSVNTGVEKRDNHLRSGDFWDAESK